MTGKTTGKQNESVKRGPTPAAAVPIPMRYGDDPHVWACWLYYEEGMTQGDIATAMGISRATVNSYLAEARDKGIVNISIEPEQLSSLTIAQELKRHFGLSDCLVVPSQESSRPLIQRLGVAGAHALRKLVKSGDTMVATWGRTVLSVGQHSSIPGLQDVTVVQATGSASASSEYTPELTAAAVANALGARCVNITAPAIVSTRDLRDSLLAEPLLADQFATMATANKILMSVSSLRPSSTIHASGFFESVAVQDYLRLNAVGSLAGRFIDARGRLISGPLDERTIGISLETIAGIETRILVAGGIDKIPAILAALRGGYATVLVTDDATGRGILNAEGVAPSDRRTAQRTTRQPDTSTPVESRADHRVKKFLNNPTNVVEEMLDGAISANQKYLLPINQSRRALVARHGPRDGKVGLVIGGGSGHEPCFLGYVGRGMADAVAVGNVFSSPPPDPILQCAQAASGGAGVLFIYGNYAGDVMNFEMAAEMAAEKGIEVRSILTTDDIASGAAEDRQSRRGVAGNVFNFKIAGAACDLGWDLERCAEVARKANARTYTVGVALEPSSLPQTRRVSFDLGRHDLEMGIGIHGEPGVIREPMRSADEIVDTVMDRIFREIPANPGSRVAVMVNSFGATPMMELYILYRRVEQRLAAKKIGIELRLVGPYCTSLDMVGASISILHLDQELTQLLNHPCETAALKIT